METVFLIFLNHITISDKEYFPISALYVSYRFLAPSYNLQSLAALTSCFAAGNPGTTELKKKFTVNSGVLQF